MPDYPIPDPQTGTIHIVVGDTAPTPEEVEELLVQLRSFNAPEAEPYTEPLEEPEPRRGMLGVAPEGVEMWNAAQATRLGGRGLERGAQYATGPLMAGAGGKVGGMLGMPFVGASLGAKIGHLARKPVEALGRGLQFAPQVAPWAGAVGLASEMTEDDGTDPLDVASLLGLGLTAFPPTSPLGMTLLTGSGLLGGAEQMAQGNTGMGALEMGLSALPLARPAARAIKGLLPGATSAVPAAAGAATASQASGVPVGVKLAPGAAQAVPGGVQPALKPNDVVNMIRGQEPDFLAQDVVRWPRPKNILRSDESTIGLARELAAQRGSTGVPTRLRAYPNPQGQTELEKALRQRRHVGTSERGKKKTQRRRPAQKDEK